MLTKSAFMAGRHCVKRMWLDAHRPELAGPLTEGEKARFSTGRQLGSLARELFPGGVMVESPAFDTDAAVGETESLLLAGTETLFEAAFLDGRRHVRCDVLQRVGDRFVLTEIKSSTKIKDEQFFDLAFQADVLRATGPHVDKTQLCLVNNRDPRGKEEPTAEQLFDVFDVTEDTRRATKKVREQSEAFLQVLDAPEPPDIRTNTFCDGCRFYDHCHEGQHARDIVFLPGIRRSGVVKFREEGYETIDSLPPDAKLSPAQARATAVVRFGQPFVEDRLSDSLGKIDFPASFIDFEAANPAMPRFEGMRPYQAYPFQWSNHVLTGPRDAPIHAEFLHPDASDPRAAFVESLLASLDGSSSVVYYSPYEVVAAKQLCDASVPGSEQLLQILTDRGVDLLEIVRQHVYFEMFRGSFSIKNVLPAMVPEMSYDGFAIRDGDSAATEFLRMVSPATNEAEKAVVRRNLSDYCRQDTLAMVAVYQKLLSLA